MMRRNIHEPITFKQFEKGLSTFKTKSQRKYRAYAVLIYYTGIRVSEALRLRKEDFTHDASTLYVEIGIRLKTKRKVRDKNKQPILKEDGTFLRTAGKKTQPLPISIDQPHLDDLLHQVRYTRKGQRVFPFSRSTALRQITKAGLGYNHLHRMTAITDFLSQQRSIADIVNWFGISVQTVNNYIGQKDLKEMGAMKR